MVGGRAPMRIEPIAGSGYGWVPMMRRGRTDDRSGGEASAPSRASAPYRAPVPADGRAAPPLRSINIPLPWLQSAPSTASGAPLTVRERLDAYARYTEQYDELDHVIELMLTEARDATRADGATFYIAHAGGKLRLSYFQNDTISSSKRGESAYAGSEIPIDSTSICGHAAKTARAINIPDAYAIGRGEPYTFNRSYDDASGYRTVSVLTVPVADADGSVMAVLQLINRRGADGEPVPFDDTDEEYSDMLAKKSAPFLRDAMERERKRDVREMLASRR